MMNITDKRHWYDGWIYDRILAPNQVVPFSKISNLVPTGSNVIDIGCGTGRLAFSLADKCRSVLGIDLSEKNISTANTTLEEIRKTNVTFLHTDLASIFARERIHFDIAILSYILHEVGSAERSIILKDAATVADKIIISDHLPGASLTGKIIREIMEFFAGREHYVNYRSFINEGGTEYLADQTGLKISHEEIHAGHLQIIILEKKYGSFYNG